MYFELSEHTPTIPHWFHVSSFARFHLSWHNTAVDRFWIVHDMFSVSVAKNFIIVCPVSLSIVRQRATTGITRLVNWLGSSTVCYRRTSKDLRCLLLLWSSGMTMSCQITPNLLQLLMGSFWPGHECWQFSTRLGVHI